MNSIQNPDFRYSFTNRLGTYVAQPLGSDEFTIQWTREAEAKLEYNKTLPNTVKIQDTPDAVTTFKKLLRLEKSIYRCEPTFITVERRCTNTGVEIWVPWFSGQFKMNAATWDLYQCAVEIKIDDAKTDECYEAQKDVEVNILGPQFPRRTILLNQPGLQIEYVDYNVNNFTYPDACVNLVYWGGTGDPYQQGYDFYYYRLEQTLDTGQTYCDLTTRWAREVIYVDCTAPSPGAEWILVDDQCPNGGQKKYARPVRKYNCSYTYPDYSNTSIQVTEYDCLIVGGSGSLASIDNGVDLGDVLQFFASTYCPGMVIVSNFFQINPDVPSLTNYVTGLRSKTRFWTLFQKSDVKRPNVANNATIANLKWEDINEALVKMANVRYRIEAGNIFRIEHVSYWQKTQGFNLPARKAADSKHFKIGGNPFKYSYATDKIPSKEEFKWMEGSPGDFVGTDIVYNSGCVTTGKDNTVTNAIDFITTDVLLCLNNPEPESKIVDDDGFVIMAADFDGSNYYLISEAPILSASLELNNSLSWAHLHRDYHKWDRPLSTGLMNNVLTKFSSVKPTKKGTAISFPLCCGDTFDPDDYIITPLGKGIVDQATFSFQSGKLEVVLLYDAEEGLTVNRAPMAMPDVATTRQDIAVLINPLANDTDPDAGDTFTAIEITLPPINGTAVVQGLQILYTPNAGYTGNDVIRYRVFDSWMEPSNSALIAINVLPPNTAPVANNDSYIGTKDTVLSIAAPGVFNNDTDDVGFTLDSYTQPAHGTVVLNSDGSFTYTPNSGYVGIDTFTYTIIDADGLTGTGTVTIDVRDPNNPVANDDFYVTELNTPLTIGAPGVLANDTTQIGTLSVVAQNVPTTQGGTANIGNNGGFTYTPPTGFIGLDTFIYTASNSTGNDQATVTVRVLPKVFVHLQQENTTYGSLTINCNGVDQQGGNYQRATFRAYFYADSAGTTPLDVTGLNLVVNARVTGMYYNAPGTYTYVLNTSASGNSTDILVDYDYYRVEYDCFNSTPVVYTNETISLESGNYTII